MTTTKTNPMIPIKRILETNHRLRSFIKPTPLQLNDNLSQKFACNILLKREDLQLGRSYKIRGAFNKISSLSKEEIQKGIVCASAGNHAQGVALSCAKLKIKGTIFMPKTTPMQKVNKVKQFGGEYIKTILLGDTYDDAFAEAKQFEEENDSIFIHPFDDEKIIAGQATIAKEIYEQHEGEIDYLFVPIGGGGLASGICSYFKQVSPETKIIGVEPAGAASMNASMKMGKVTRLKNIDKFVDGASVAQVGNLTFDICQDLLDDIIPLPEGKTCSVILQLYNDDAMVVEPSGALSIGALDFYKEKIKDKNVVCVVSGGNNDITRMEEIKERSMIYEGLKHYFIINFPRRAGSFKDFVNDVMGKNDEITTIEYDSKKSSGDTTPALIGIFVPKRENLDRIIANMDKIGLNYELLNENPMLYNYLSKG